MHARWKNEWNDIFTKQDNDREESQHETMHVVKSLCQYKYLYAKIASCTDDEDQEICDIAKQLTREGRQLQGADNKIHKLRHISKQATGV